MATVPTRGDLWWVDFSPTRGREQTGHRPALVISADWFNRCPAELVVVCPLTTKERRVRSHVRVEPPTGGLTRLSFIKVEDMRSVSTQRLDSRIGQVPPETLSEVKRILRVLLDL